MKIFLFQILVKMTEILIALPIEYSSIILADKLNSDSNFKVTFYVDPLIDSEFQSAAINDIQSVCPDPVKTIQTKVCKLSLIIKLSIFRLVWL